MALRETSRGRRRQPGREEVAGAHGRTRRARARPPGREEDDRGGPDGLGRIGAGPAGLPGERQVVFSALFYCSVCFIFKFILPLF